MARSKIPVTLITGYLGSGKTTLINQLIRIIDDRPLKIAVLVNEFGSIDIDGALIKEVAGEESVIELANGCLCCVVKGEFRSALESLSKRRSDFDHILIET